MKKLLSSLPARLAVAIAAGVLLGLVLPESAMGVVVTAKYILGQVITFCVPLIVIGFIAPSITRLGNSATRMLGVAVLLAYAEELLHGQGACRVHGGGFAGTIQVFLPKDLCQSFVPAMEGLTGEGSCHLLSFREAGTGCVIS